MGEKLADENGKILTLSPRQLAVGRQPPCGMDLQEIREWVSTSKDAILALAAIWAGIMGFYGLRTWRRELKGKAEFAKAKEVLKAVYRVREAFKHVRHPAIFQYEYPKDMCDESGHLKTSQRYEGTAHVYETRWKAMAEAFNTLEELTLDAQVEWGAGFQNVIMPLRKCKVELLIAVQDYIEAHKDRHSREPRSADEKKEQREILYYTGEDSKHDDFTNQINQAVQKFEEKLRPLVK
jgi:hypothetical protein